MPPRAWRHRACGAAAFLLCFPGWCQPLADPVRADGSLAPEWRFVGLPRHVPTRFEAATLDGQRALKIETAASYGNLVHAWSGPAGPLRWRWRLDQPLAGGKATPDLRTKSGDDVALKVCVMFDHPLERVPLVERLVLRAARRMSGEPLPAATVCYLWDSAGPAGAQATNAFTRRLRFITLQGADAPLAQWVAETRDVGADFARLFADELPPGAEPPTVMAVAVGADSDNTASRSTGWLAGLHWGR